MLIYMVTVTNEMPTPIRVLDISYAMQLWKQWLCLKHDNLTEAFFLRLDQNTELSIQNALLSTGV